MIRFLGMCGIAVVMMVGWLALTPRGSGKPGAPSGEAGAGNAKLSELPVFVRVGPAQSVRLDRSVEVTGNIVAHNEISIASKILGKVRAVHADEGQAVPEGKVLVQLDEGDWNAQVAQARASLAMARARLKQAEEGVLRNAKARLTQSQEMLTMTRPTVDAQVRQSEAKLALDRQKLQQAHTQVEATRTEVTQTIAKNQAALEAAKTRWSLLKAGGREEERKQAAAQVAGAQASYDEAKRNADRMATLLKEGAVAQADLDLATTKLETARAQLETARQQQTIVTQGARAEELDIARNQIKEAEAQLAIALNDHRKVELAEHEVRALQEQVRQSQAALEVTQASRMQVPLRERDVESAGAMLQNSEQDVAALRAAVDQAKANLDLQTNNLKATAIRAPISGRLTKRTVERGEIMTTGRVVFTLVNDAMVFFEAKVSELDVPSVTLGTKVAVTVDALPGRAVEGTVAELLAAGDTRSRYFTVKIAILNKRGALKQGMFARAKLIADTVANAVMIPSEAVISSGDRREVVVVKNEIAERRVVVVGSRQRERVQIVTGVSAGEEVVVSGQELVRSGGKVNVTNRPQRTP